MSYRIHKVVFQQTQVIVMIQPPVKMEKKHAKLAEVVDSNMIWIETEEGSTKPSEGADTELQNYLRKEHQAYLTQKQKRREEMLKNKKQEFGDSSSDSEEEIVMEKSKTKDSTNGKPVIKNIEYFSGKASSKAESQKSLNLKKVNSVHVGPGKTAQSIDTLDISVPSKKGVDVWIEQNLKFKEKTLTIGTLECSYYDINKLKVIFSNAAENSYKVKLNWGSQQFLFAAARNKLHFELSYPYYILARVIAQKLQIMNKSKPFDTKGQHFPQSFMKNAFIYGKILKKSRLISRWSEVFAVINKEGLWYRKKFNEKQKLLVKRTEITQLWTRFQFQQGFLVVKLFENSSKIELGIPVCNFMQREGWLYYLYDLIFQRQ